MSACVIFVEPCFPKNQREFVRALAAVGAQVVGIGERPKAALDPQLAGWLHHYEQIGNVTDVAALEQAVRWVQERTPVHALEAVVEAHVMAAAHVRERCGIAGTSVRTAWLCRDKPAMKEALRAAGVPCAQSIGSDDAAELIDFARRIGFPVIVKPRDGAGAAGATRADNIDELRAALAEFGLGRGRSVAIEEFLSGHEGFYDTLSVRGRPAMDFVSHYYPNVLEAMRTRWISPQIAVSNRVDIAPAYQEVRAMGQRVVDTLGIQTSATHMEWFFGPKGLKFSEIGCRPPGVLTWDLYSAANDVDLYVEWASAIVHGRVQGRLSRRRAAGLIAVRPECDGRITGYDGSEALQQRWGAAIMDAHLPPVGTPTQPVEAGYMANAWVRVLHPDYDQTRRILDDIGTTLKVRASGR